MKRLPFLALALLVACDKPSPPPVPTGLSLKGASGDYGHWNKFWRFSVEGPDFSTALTLKLLRITSKGADLQADHTFRNPGARGSFTLLEQHGEPFDRPGQIYFELLHDIPAPSKSLSTSPFPPLQGPFPYISQQGIKDGSVTAGVETVVFARSLANDPNHAFGTLSVESLLKDVAGTDDVMMAVTLRWDP